MTAMNVCSNCGHKLAESNKTGECYRVCKPKVTVIANCLEEPPSGVVRRHLVSLTCDQFRTNEAELASNTKGRILTRARYVAAYLLVYDLKLSHSNAGKVIGRDGSFVKDALEVLVREMDDYRHDITVIRTALEQKLDEYKTQAA